MRTHAIGFVNIFIAVLMPTAIEITREHTAAPALIIPK